MNQVDLEAAPLTAEEEAEARRLYGDDSYHDWSAAWIGRLLATLDRERSARQSVICGVVSDSGLNGEPLACAHLPEHETPHSWATLPTFPSDAAWRSLRSVAEKWSVIAELRETLERITKGNPLDDGTDLREWIEWAQTDAYAVLRLLDMADGKEEVG